MTKTNTELEFCLLSKTEKLLMNYAQHEYLLHGSVNPYRELVPYPAECTSGCSDSNKEAVYAAGGTTPVDSKIASQIAIAHGILNKSKFKSPGRMAVLVENKEVYLEITSNILNSIQTGYVHILEPKGFKHDKENYQYYSENPVQPIDIIPVKLEDYSGWFIVD